MHGKVVRTFENSVGASVRKQGNTWVDALTTVIYLTGKLLKQHETPIQKPQILRLYHSTNLTFLRIKSFLQTIK